MGKWAKITFMIFIIFVIVVRVLQMWSDSNQNYQSNSLYCVVEIFSYFLFILLICFIFGGWMIETPVKNNYLLISVFISFITAMEINDRTQ